MLAILALSENRTTPIYDIAHAQQIDAQGAQWPVDLFSCSAKFIDLIQSTMWNTMQLNMVRPSTIQSIRPF